MVGGVGGVELEASVGLENWRVTLEAVLGPGCEWQRKQISYSCAAVCTKLPLTVTPLACASAPESVRAEEEELARAAWGL